MVGGSWQWLAIGGWSLLAHLFAAVGEVVIREVPLAVAYLLLIGQARLVDCLVLHFLSGRGRSIWLAAPTTHLLSCLQFIVFDYFADLVFKVFPGLRGPAFKNAVTLVKGFVAGVLPVLALLRVRGRAMSCMRCREAETRFNQSDAPRPRCQIQLLRTTEGFGGW